MLPEIAENADRTRMGAAGAAGRPPPAPVAAAWAPAGALGAPARGGGAGPAVLRGQASSPAARPCQRFPTPRIGPLLQESSRNQAVVWFREPRSYSLSARQRCYTAAGTERP